MLMRATGPASSTAQAGAYVAGGRPVQSKLAVDAARKQVVAGYLAAAVSV